MNPYLIIACLLAIIGAGAGGFKLGQDHELASQAREEEMLFKATTIAANTAAEAIAKIKVKNTTILNEVQKEIHEKVVYAECRHSPDGLRLTNQALSAGAKPAGSGKLPGTDAPK